MPQSMTSDTNRQPEHWTPEQRSAACLVGCRGDIHSQSARSQRIRPVQVLRHPEVPEAVAHSDQQRRCGGAVQM